MLTYKKAGVDIDLADRLVAHIRRRAPAIGGFAGLFPLDLPGAEPHCLVACTDGVGTKLKLAFAWDRHETVGIDLVAMCVNDLITCGARPLFFLDYYAVGRLNLAQSKRVLSGIIAGCRMGKSALLGGETAEMPGFYPPGEYDLAGFSVGIVKKSEIITGGKIFPGDVLLGIPSSGPHSNGYSLIRRIFNDRIPRRLAETLMAPTRIYVADIQRLSESLARENEILLGLAHITGGGIVENLPRLLPAGCRAVVKRDSWETPEIFREIARRGKVPEAEMWRTFNMGIGMILVMRPNSVGRARKILPELVVMGEIVKGRPSVSWA